MNKQTMRSLVGIATVALLALTLATSVSASVTGFVTRSGSSLVLNGSTFRFSGCDIYWLGLDENDAGVGYAGVAYPTNFRVDDVLATAAGMGATVVRAHTLGDSVGGPLTLEPSKGNFNSTAFQYMDYAIYSASNHGIRLMIPLTDNYNYYSGGEITFCNWENDSTQSDFYSNSAIISDFEQYVSTILNHVNQYTGVAYKNDPTIMAWETGNEIHPTLAWTNTIASYIKGIDTKHLIVDGTYGVPSYLSGNQAPNIDIASDHYYPLNASQLQSDANTAASYGKAFITGEYAWNDGDLNTFLNDAVSDTNVSGDMYWSLFGHLDNWGFEQHSDGYTLHYPGDTSTMDTDVQLLRSHAYAMAGVSTPAAGTPLTPLITAIDVNGTIAWRGAALADTYQVERSTAGASGPWTVATTGTVTDNDTPWVDSSNPGGAVWYRIKAANVSGVFGPYSPVYEAVLSGGNTSQLFDALNDFSHVYNRSTGWQFDTSNSSYFNGDPSRAQRTANDAETLTYNLNNIGGFTIRSWDWTNSSYNLTVQASPDNSTWTTIPTSVSDYDLGSANWSYDDISNSGALASGMNYLRLTVSGGIYAWFPEIGQISINYGNWTGSAPAAPTGLTATSGNAQVSLAWTASSGAASYNVYRGTSSGGESSTAVATGVTGTSYTNTGLTNGTKYYYKVAAVNSSGTSAQSNEASATPAAPSVPAAPTGLTATAGNAQIALSWTASSGASSYNVYRGTSAGGESATAIATGVTTTSYTNTGLTNGTKYYYKVAAVNGAGTSAQSSEASATPVAPAVPAAPTNLTATAGNAQVSLAWTGSSGATSYNVYRATSSGGEGSTAIATGVTTTNYTNTGLTNGTQYYYKVAAVNSSGTSAQSSEASATPVNAGTAPGAPSSLSATGGNASVALTWSAPTTGGAPTSYTVKYGTSSGTYTSQVAGITGTSTTVTGLSNGTTYFFVVVAVNSAGTSANSNQSTAQPSGATPSAPQLNSVTPGTGSVAVNWTGTGGGGNPTSYTVAYGTSSGNYTSQVTGLGTANTYTTVNGLTSGTTYYFVVYAINSAATPSSSAPSNQLSCKPN